MKGTDRAILLTLMMVGLLATFYFMILAPKRDQASTLDEEITTLQSSVDTAEQVVAYAQQAREEFPQDYTRVVTLGKAVPDQADSASMLVQLSSISEKSKVEFRGIELGQGAGAAAPAPAPPAEPAPSPEGAQPPAEGEPAPENVPAGGAPTVSDVAQPATEATAASLPIGASVGPAGLATLPYKLAFKGTFFQVADFFSGVDELVGLREQSGQVVADGRLLTLDGFALQGGGPGASPELGATFAVTSYVTPVGQGLTLGATPGGPAPPISPAQPQTTPASTVTP